MVVCSVSGFSRNAAIHERNRHRSRNGKSFIKGITAGNNLCLLFVIGRNEPAGTFDAKTGDEAKTAHIVLWLLNGDVHSRRIRYERISNLFVLNGENNGN